MCMDHSCNDCSVRMIANEDCAKILATEALMYRKALLNLAEYVLQGEYKKETLKILGLD